MSLRARAPGTRSRHARPGRERFRRRALVGGTVAATAVARADPALSDRLLAETRRSLPDAG